LAVPPGFQHAQGDAEHKEHHAQINRAFLEHIGGLGAPDLVCDASAEGGTQAFLLGALHQHEQHDEQAHDNEQSADEVDEKGQHGTEIVDAFGKMTNGNSRAPQVGQKVCKIIRPCTTSTLAFRPHPGLSSIYYG
jgi:hypothetical protein